MRNRGLLLLGWMPLVALIAGCQGQEDEAGAQKKAADARATVAAAMPTAPPTAMPTTEPTTAPTTAPEPTEPPPTATPEEKKAAAEDLELLGIVRGGSSAGALIGFDGNQEIFRRGDTVFDHGTLKDVREDSVVIRSGDSDVTLTVVKEATPVPAEPIADQVVETTAAAREAVPPPATAPVSRTDARTALKNFGKVLESAEAKRVSVGGGHGVELGKVESSSFLAQLGLRSGDVLQKINDVAIDDVDKVPDLSSAADGRDLNVSYSRNGIGLTVARPLR